MDILLEDIGKKYNKHWIFRHVDLELPQGSKIAITGNNGSGKSTLLQVIAAYRSPSEGELSYKETPLDEVRNHIALCTPYLTLVEDMNLGEMVDFHFTFKQMIEGVNKEDFFKILKFDESKLIKEYSSGMKQRLKLLLAFFSDVSVILLDEPTANLDKQGVNWYNELVQDRGASKTIIVASNEEREYTFCDREISVMDYKG